MIIIELNNIKDLNVSLQVGDAIYATPTSKQTGAKDREAYQIGKTYLVGVLKKIEKIEEAKFFLYVNEQLNDVTNDGGTGYMPNANDFLMFSKYSQESGEVTGYYAKAKFVNNSKEKAEIFAVSSEVIINSK